MWNMQVETVQADRVQQVIRYLLAKSIQFSITHTGAGGAYEYDYEGYAGAAAGQGTGA